MNMSTRTSFVQEPTENGASGSDNNNFNSAARQQMFHKVLTPSDVGKLNRLVIPKQHAENHFPLEDNQTGTLLDFEDRTGKTWRFRYSYWNSSQSYVMTKGWSSFVKEKNLDQGDIVSFHRGHVPDANEPDKRRNILFIDWRHRPPNTNINHHDNYSLLGPLTYPTASYYPVTEYYRRFPPFYQEREFLGYGYGRIIHGPLDHHHQWNLGRSEPLVYDSYPVSRTMRVTSSSAMLPPPQPRPEGTVKTVRLFGVDVEESSSSRETRGEMSVAGYSPSAPVVIRDDDGSTWRLPRGEMGVSSSSGMHLSDDEMYQRKGKSLEL